MQRIEPNAGQESVWDYPRPPRLEATNKHLKINPRDAKIKTTVFIDGDILQHFRRRAEQPNAAEFQILINQELRTAMERDLAEVENELDEKVGGQLLRV